MFSVEKDISFPLPMKERKTYPFAEMGIGDSFEIPAEWIKDVRNAANSYGNYHGKKFSVRKTDGTGRCWRLS